MGIFPRQLAYLLAFLQDVGKIIQVIGQSKIVRYMKRNRLFTYIPMAFLSWQLAVTGHELETYKEQADFYRTRLDTYYRDWDEVEFGVWEKMKVGDRYVFLGVNDAYVRNFLRPNGLEESDILGKDNIQAFGKEIGKAWRSNDSMVAKDGRQINDVEPARYGDRTGYVFISKWRKIRRNGDTTVMGMAIKIDTIYRLYIKELKSNKKQE